MARIAERVDTSFERHNARPRTEMPASLRKELEEHFEPHDRALELWLARTPSWRE